MAIVYLEQGENYNVASKAKIFGSSGKESITIFEDISNVEIDSAVDKIIFTNSYLDYAYRQVGISIEIYKDGELITTVKSPSQDIVFSDGELNIIYDSGNMRVGDTLLENRSDPVSVYKNNLNPYSTVISGVSEDIPTYETEGVKSLISGYKWGDNIIFFSFNEEVPEEYYTDEDLFDNFHSLRADEKNVVREVLSEIESYTDVHFIEVESGGDIRFSKVNMDINVAGFAYLPDRGNPLGGDVFLSNEFENPSSNLELEVGGQGRSVIAHEIGHALGLKHPFEGSNILVESEDDVYHTVMSYTCDSYKLKFDETEEGLYYEFSQVMPESYSIFDVHSLQYLYGNNSDNNTMDNTYSLSFEDFTSVTIWDGGGVDSFDLMGNVGNTVLDLREGALSSIDRYDLEDLISFYQQKVDERYFEGVEEVVRESYSTLYDGYNNLGIAKGTIIENAYLGLGDDIVYDNKVDNVIKSGSGNDKVHVGRGGSDYIDGGGGMDLLIIDGSIDDGDGISGYDYDADENMVYLIDEEGGRFSAVEIENIEVIEFDGYDYYV